MRSVENRLQRLESCLISDKDNEQYRDVQSMSDEEILNELAGLIHTDIQEDECVFPDIGPEVRAMSREAFMDMFISMDSDERRRLYYTPLENKAREEGIQI